MTHPCIRCGACCAHFRVAFHWMEAETGPGDDGVPIALTEKLDPHRLVMLGTQAAHPRCTALEGVVGQQASCSIYARRPSVCREMQPSWEFGSHSPQCDKARLAHGLQPLSRDVWLTEASAPSVSCGPL